MEGLGEQPASPGAAGCISFSVEGVLRAEKFTPDGEFIGMVYGYTEDELARKLSA